jgi:hypothetical protein
MTICCAGALATLLILPVHGQWLNYPTPGLPRTADGKPDLTAPAPRTPDGKPDLSGIWEPQKNRPCPPYGCPDQRLTNEFMNVGLAVKGGLPLQKWAADLVKVRSATNGKDDPTSQCLPGGIIKMHTSPFYRKLVQTPGLLLILFERETGYRQIFTDGRPLPEDPNPNWNGYSTGKWEGDTLVVQSIGFHDGTWLDRDGNPLTEAGRITERFRRINFGKMEIEITVDDPKAYTKPFTFKITHLLAAETEMMDYTCLENQKYTAR